MKCCVHDGLKTHLWLKRLLLSAGIESRTARSLGQCLTHSFSDAKRSLTSKAGNHFKEVTISQGINESANFRFLPRLSVIFGLCQDCP